MDECARVRENAAELALGQASGDERADALAHIATCVDCRRYVAELADAADALLILAPEAEPSPGFESRVLAGVRPSRAHAPRRWLAAAAVAVIVASAGSWFAASRAYRLDRQTAAAFKALGGHELRAASILATAGADAGHAVAYDGKPSWIFLWVKPTGEPGARTYTIELAYADGRTRTLEQTMHMTGHGGTWGGLVEGRIDALRTIRLRNSDGTTEYVARFD
jgi:hypothetical protein